MKKLLLLSLLALLALGVRSQSADKPGNWKLIASVRRIRCAADTYFRFFRLRLLCRIAACAKQRHKRGKKQKDPSLFSHIFSSVFYVM